MSDRESVTRGILPHWYVPGAAHFVTYRLAGTLPQTILAALRAERQARLNQKPPDGLNFYQFKLRVHKQMFLAYDHHLDHVDKLDWLTRAEVAAIIRENLYHHDGHKYHLLAYCIMPNHVHVLLQPTEVELAEQGQAIPSPDGVHSDEFPDKRSPLAKIMHSLKSYTANRINEVLGRAGQCWQHESYDHWVRDDEELERIVAYIVANPVKAGLARYPHDWPFGSAHDRFRRDGELSGYLPG
jgi:putative DNA methylase